MKQTLASLEATRAIIEIKSELDRLAHEDASAVSARLRRVMRNRLRRDPYGTLILSLAVGFGLGRLESADFRKAAIAVGKLVILRALSSDSMPH